MLIAALFAAAALSVATTVTGPLALELAAPVGLLALGLILYEHSLVRENDLSKLNIAFFNMNGYISVTIFIFTLLDVLV